MNNKFKDLKKIQEKFLFEPSLEDFNNKHYIKELQNISFPHFDILLSEANSNLPQAQYELGLYYYFEKNYNEAQYWLKKALENNQIESIYYLAMIEKNGYIDQPNIEQYFKYLKEGAAIKTLNCVYEIGKCYLFGIGTEINEKEAFRHFLYAGINEHPIACYHLGEICFNGKIVDKNYEEAYIWFEKSYRNKYAPALYHLSIMTLQGLGTEQDIDSGISGLLECQKLNIKAAAKVLDFLKN